jgi:2-isopropylmalate synthase
MRPEEVGVSATLVLGKHSGRHAVQKRCEQIGCSEMDRRTLDEVYRAVIEHADREKVVSDADLAAIVGPRDRRPPLERPKPAVAPAAADLQSTPAEVGYGHGV